MRNGCTGKTFASKRWKAKTIAKQTHNYFGKLDLDTLHAVVCTRIYHMVELVLSIHFREYNLYVIMSCHWNICAFKAYMWIRLIFQTLKFTREIWYVHKYLLNRQTSYSLFFMFPFSSIASNAHMIENFIVLAHHFGIHSNLFNFILNLCS